jgi:hypothetical protein
MTRSIVRTFAFVFTSLCLLGVVDTASAYWSAGGTGSGEATVGTLGPPTGVTATASGATVEVAWTPPAPPSPDLSDADVTYRVERDGTFVCGSSEHDTITGSGCADLDVPPGTYRYTVTAVFRSWSTASDPTSDVTVEGATPVAEELQLGGG